MIKFEHIIKSPFGRERKFETQIEILNENHEGIPVVIAPGFLTQDNEDWKKYIADRIDAPIYYIKWRSESILSISTSALTSVATGLVMPVRGLVMSAYFIASLFKSWSSAAKESSLAGKDLAKVLNDVWDNDDKAIFIGHSLGVRVITEAMRSLNSDNVLTSISIAGAILKEDYEERINQIKSHGVVEHTNIYSNNDSILKWLYKIGEFTYTKLPIGLVKSDLKNVKNHPVNIGHTEYHENSEFNSLIIELHSRAIKKHSQN